MKDALFVNRQYNQKKDKKPEMSFILCRVLRHKQLSVRYQPISHQPISYQPTSHGIQLRLPFPQHYRQCSEYQ